MNGTDLTLIVLAGGMGRRMQAPKSSMRVGGKPALVHLLDQLIWTGPRLLVTAPANRSPIGAERFDGEIVDPLDDAGPLMGVIGGLGACTTELALFVPVDMPLLERGLIEAMAEAVRANTHGRMGVRGDGSIEPFPCVLPASARMLVQQQWDANRRSLHGLLRAGICVPFDVSGWPASVWTNLNTPGDLAAFESDVRPAP